MDARPVGVGLAEECVQVSGNAIKVPGSGGGGAGLIWIPNCLHDQPAAIGDPALGSSDPTGPAIAEGDAGHMRAVAIGIAPCANPVWPQAMGNDPAAGQTAVRLQHAEIVVKRRIVHSPVQAGVGDGDGLAVTVQPVQVPFLAHQCEITGSMQHQGRRNVWPELGNPRQVCQVRDRCPRQDADDGIDVAAQHGAAVGGDKRRCLCQGRGIEQCDYCSVNCSSGRGYWAGRLPPGGVSRRAPAAPPHRSTPDRSCTAARIRQPTARAPGARTALA